MCVQVIKSLENLFEELISLLNLSKEQPVKHKTLYLVFFIVRHLTTLCAISTLGKEKGPRERAFRYELLFVVFQKFLLTGQTLELNTALLILRRLLRWTRLFQLFHEILLKLTIRLSL